MKKSIFNKRKIEGRRKERNWLLVEWPRYTNQRGSCLSVSTEILHPQTVTIWSLRPDSQSEEKLSVPSVSNWKCARESSCRQSTALHVPSLSVPPFSLLHSGSGGRAPEKSKQSQDQTNKWEMNRQRARICTFKWSGQLLPKLKFDKLPCWAVRGSDEKAIT